MKREITHKTVAITVWNGRVSPVFDSAQTLKIVKIVDTKIIDSHYLRFNFGTITMLQQMLTELAVDVILCGAISEEPAVGIEEAGCELIPFITGEVEQVLSTYIDGNENWTNFSMPGCTGNNCGMGFKHCRRKQHHAKQNVLQNQNKRS